MNIEAEFFYQSQPRLQFIFDSPNHCSVILSMLALILCGVLGVLLKKEPSKKRLAWMMVTAMVLLGLLAGLVLTYSRGGWVAFMAGLVFYGLAVKRGKKISVGVLVVFLGLVWLLPHGWQRMNSVTEVTEDRSILHRVMVWQGALTMAADHPLTGVPGHQFGSEFSAWYQPLTMHTRYLAALNNYLTIAAERGLPALLAYLLLLGVPFAPAFYLARSRQNILILSLLAAEVVYLVSGLFTHSTIFWHVTGLFLLVYAVALGYLGWHLFRKNLTRRLFLKISTLTAGGMAALVLVIYGAGLFFLLKMPCRVHAEQITDSIPAFIVTPQNQSPRGMVVYFHDKGDSARESGKAVLRPLAAAGFLTVGADYRAGGLDGLRDAEVIVQWAARSPLRQSLPLYLAGLGVGGRMAVLAAKGDIKGVVAVDAAVDWPFPELSPLEQIDTLTAPLLLIYQGSISTATDTEKYQKAAESKRKPVSVFYIDNLDNSLNSQELWIDKCINFLLKSD